MALTTLPNKAFSQGSMENFRNIIINGDMSISQRGTSTASITGNGYYTADRFNFLVSMGTWTQSQSTDVPTGQGFAKSLKLECTTANASPAAGNICIIRQLIEGQMLQQLKKGTSNAESLTLSFWIKSNKTGTYIAELYDSDNSRQISKSYTINSTDTWEKKTINYDGDTTGALDNDNNASLALNIWFGAGSTYTSGTLSTSWTSSTSANRVVGQVNLADTVSNYINITGVQLEVGTSASDFEFLPYDVNLRRCQRYYEKNGGYVGFFSSNSAHMKTNMIVPKRTQSPSISWSNSPMTVVIYGNGADSANSGSSGTDQRSIVFSNDNHHIRLLNMTGAGTGDGKGCFLTDDTYVKIDAEL